MPFPLAHPAAVLPFRRFCPRSLCFPALLVGSVSPDAGYVLSRYDIDDFAHSLVGLVGFCLPVSLVALWLLRWLGRSVLGDHPGVFACVLSPFVQISATPIRSVLLSVVLGAATHIAWDSFTHNEGWIVERVPFFEEPLGLVRGHKFRVCHLLWYASTITGIAWLGFAYQDWREVATGFHKPTPRRIKLRNALILSALALPIAIAHHIGLGACGNVFIASGLALLMLGFIWFIEPVI